MKVGILILIIFAIGCNHVSFKRNLNLQNGEIELRILELKCLNEEFDTIKVEIRNNSDNSVMINSQTFYFGPIMTSDRIIIKPRNHFNEIRKVDENPIFLMTNESKIITLEISFLHHFNLEKSHTYLISIKYENTRNKVNGEKVLNGEFQSNDIEFKLCN
ncbi:MAG: hypothetical protein AAGA77_15770 [Bacteroidota bacterium]